MKKVFLGLIVFIAFASSCLAMGGTPPESVVEITSDPSGARIEINQDVIGNTPLTYVISKNHTYFRNGVECFHDVVIIQAFPTPELVKKYETLYLQGKMFFYDDEIPKHIHFDLTLKASPQEIKQDIKLDINK